MLLHGCHVISVLKPKLGAVSSAAQLATQLVTLSDSLPGNSRSSVSWAIGYKTSCSFCSYFIVGGTAEHFHFVFLVIDLWRIYAIYQQRRWEKHTERNGQCNGSSVTAAEAEIVLWSNRNNIWLRLETFVIWFTLYFTRTQVKKLLCNLDISLEDTVSRFCL